MKRRNPPKDLTKAIESGYRPMFMTGPEIKHHYNVYSGDIDDHEMGGEDTWQRKLEEAKMTGEERFGKDAFKPGRSINEPILRRQGIQPKESLESITKKKGAPEGFISVDAYTPEVLGGHHRVALSNEQFKSHIFPVKYFDSLEQAKQEPGYK